VSLTLAVPEELVEAIAERAAQIVVERLDVDLQAWPEWMGIETASRYLDISPERLRKLQARRQLPYHQEGPGCRVFFNRHELDTAMAVHLQRARGG
jgi:hypothetical protein